MTNLMIHSPSGLIQPTRMILGTTHFGGKVNETEAQAIMNRYAELGGNAIDTARIYGDWMQTGLPGSEGVVGRWIKESGLRDRFVLITKGAHPRLAPGMPSRMTSENIRVDVERSLEALDSPIDLYFLHRDDPNVPVDQIMPVLDSLVCSGSVRAIGASNWSTGRIREANAFAMENSLTPFSASEIQWSLARMDRPLINKLFDPTVVGVNTESFDEKANELPVLSFTSLAWGYYGKKAAGVESLHQEALSTPENIRRLAIVKKWAAKTGQSPNGIAVSYIISHPRIQAAALVGVSGSHQLDELMAAMHQPMPPEFFQEIEAVAG